MRISTPFSVMRIVCSNCADRELSSDIAVHSSSKTCIGGKPSVTIGSETTDSINVFSLSQTHKYFRINIFGKRESDSLF